MSPVDTAWLRMDRENHLMAIKGVLVLQDRLRLDALAALLKDRLLGPFPRFTQRVVQNEEGAWWIQDEQFDLLRHLRRRRVPSGEPQEQLERLISRLAAEPLPSDRPLWAIELIERFHGGSALVIRLHHCLADGLALMNLLRCLTDPLPPAGSATPRNAPRTASTAQGCTDQWVASAAAAASCRPVAGEPPAAWASSPADADEPAWASLLTRWLDDPRAAERLGQMGGLLAAELAKLLVLPQDSPTRLKGHTGRSKAVAWSPPLPLREVKALAQALGCSVNDVLLSCVAGAFRRHLVAQGDDLRSVNIRTLVPINLRPSLQRRPRPGALGNRFGLVPLLMPLDVDNPMTRLRLITSRMRALKQSLLPPLSLGLLGVLGMAPRSVQGAALGLLASKATAVVTHVPGPRQCRQIAGARIAEVMFWVPQSGDVGLGVSIFSYAEQVRFGLISDAGILPQPAALMPHFNREFEQLLLAVLLGADVPAPESRSFERQLRRWAKAAGLDSAT